MKKLYWRIQGFDSSTQIFNMTVGIGQFTDEQMRQLLKALAAKAGLSYEEIVGAYSKRGTKRANNLLDVHKELESPILSCGSNPHFAASVVDENGKNLRYPQLS